MRGLLACISIVSYLGHGIQRYLHRQKSGQVLVNEGTNIVQGIMHCKLKMIFFFLNVYS
jgi:hypothetical protein